MRLKTSNTISGRKFYLYPMDTILECGAKLKLQELAPLVAMHRAAEASVNRHLENVDANRCRVASHHVMAVVFDPGFGRYEKTSKVAHFIHIDCAGPWLLLCVVYNILPLICPVSP